MRSLLLFAVLLAGCGGSDPGERYLSGTWTQEGSTCRFRVIEDGSRLEGWTDDGRRVSGSWPVIVLARPYEAGIAWTRIRPGVYAHGSVEAVLEVRR